MQVETLNALIEWIKAASRQPCDCTIHERSRGHLRDCAVSKIQALVELLENDPTIINQ